MPDTRYTSNNKQNARQHNSETAAVYCTGTLFFVVVIHFISPSCTKMYPSPFITKRIITTLLSLVFVRLNSTGYMSTIAHLVVHLLVLEAIDHEVGPGQPGTHIHVPHAGHQDERPCRDHPPRGSPPGTVPEQQKAAATTTTSTATPSPTAATTTQKHRQQQQRQKYQQQRKRGPRSP